MATVQDILHTVYGYDDFRPYQKDIIEALLAGRDALVVMPTGGGKSLCYQIPAMVRLGVGVVVSPLIALMQDQVDALRQLGVKAAFLNSTLDYASVREVERQLLNSTIDLLYIAPERLLLPRTLELLGQARLALLAIDEAHCVSQWGHDFRPEYLQLSVLGERFPGVPRIALTATADARTRQEIIDNLALTEPQVFVTGFDRPNIRYAIVDSQNARAQLGRFIAASHPRAAGIVYCLSRAKVEATAAWLSEQGRIALPYHAGLDNATRKQHQQRFLREEGIIIVATIAFGMGIDKPDVRFVAHLSLPKSIEAYYQETGRAGRDDLPADAWMAYSLQDVILLRQMLRESEASEERKRIEHHKLEALLGFCEITGCRRQALLAYFGEALTVPCGNCDNCLNPPQTWNATVAAQKALSCVYRTGQRFGVNYVIDVLLGKDDARIRRFRHDQLSTFGIGKDRTAVEWRVLFRQLIAGGFLSVDVDGHGALQLTANSRPVLRGEAPLWLRQISKPLPAPSEPVKVKTDNTPLRAADEPIWQALRAKRLELAREQVVPPYVIFHDKTLLEMTRRRPRTLAELAEIDGVGARKLERYGETFLSVLGAFAEDAPRLYDHPDRD